MNKRMFLVFALLLALLTACGVRDAPAPTAAPGGATRPTPAAGEPPATAASSDSDTAPSVLEHTSWTLVLLRGAPPLADSTITLTFSDDSFGGSAGCNHYGGRYRATQAGELELHEVGMTEVGCEQPLLEQESAYIETLSQVAGYRLRKDRLELLDATAAPLLLFAQQQRQAAEPPGLENTRWVLVSQAGAPPLEGSQITLAFADGTATGSAGCRHYRATYVISGDELDFPTIEMKESACPHRPAFSEQEQRFVEALGWANFYRIEDGRLEIVTTDGDELIFEPMS